MAVISSLLIKLSVAHRGVETGFSKARESIDRFERKVNQSSAALNRIGRAMTSIGVGPGLVAAIGGITTLASVAAPAVNTVLALPAALAQFAAAGAVVKLAGANMGDAVKAVAEGSKDAKEKLALLPPSARLVAQTVGDMQKKLTGAVQEKLFAPWSKEFATLAHDQAPMLARGMGTVAESIGRVARQGVIAANTPFVSGVVAQTFAETARSTDALASATPSLVKGLAAVVKVGNPFVTTLIRSATSAAAAKAEWLASADGMAWLERKLEQGRETTAKLIKIVSNFGSVMLSIMGQSRISAGSLLDKIVALTDRMAAWGKSVEGQEKIAAFMDKARSLATQMWEAFGRVVDVAIKMSDAFNKLPQPLQDTLLTLSAYSIVLGPLVTRFAPLIALVIRLGVAAAASVGGLYKFMFANTTAAGTSRAAWLVARVQLLSIWIQLQVASAAAAVRSAAAWVVMRAQLIAIWVQLQVMAIAAAARTAAAWIASHVAMAVAATVNMARTVAVTVAGWVFMAAQSLIQAARMAAAWLIAMGPVGIVIAIIVALVALIISNWDTIVSWTITAWNWVWSKGIKPVIDIIMAGVHLWVNNVMAAIGFFSALPGRIYDWFIQASIRAGAAMLDLLGRVRALPGQVLSALGNLGSLLYNAGRDLIQGLINGIGDMVGRLVGKAREVASAAMNAIKGALGIGSPSKITYKYAIWVGEGAVNGLDKMVAPTTRAAERLADAAINPWAALGRTAPYSIDQGVRVGMTPTQPAADDSPRGPGGWDGAPGGSAPLVSIGNFYAGSQTPDETARALDWKLRTGT